MAKLRTVYRCPDCGASSPKWQGRCPGCGLWNTLIEEVDEERPVVVATAPSPPRPITALDGEHADPVPTGIDELDRVLGGGLVAGSVTLVGGEPGIGKSTLLIDVAVRRARRGDVVLYASAEESPQQVHQRAARLGALDDRLFLTAESEVAALLATIEIMRPALVVVDSIQTMVDRDLASAPGSVAQVRQCAHRLVRVAKDQGVAVVLVGHVTKDGALAGPRVLEHEVDTVLSFDGDRHHALRLVRAVKHRFGPTGELGVFEMTERGLVDVADPSSMFLADRHPGTSGTIVVPTMEGRRTMLVEVQSLVLPTGQMMPRRSVQGLDQSRLAMLLAVLERRAGIRAGQFEVYASVVGGVRIIEPGADLAVALAVASAVRDVALANDLVAVGEVGLGGEIRQVGQLQRRLTEAARLGFARAIVPAHTPEIEAPIDLVRAPTLSDAIELAGLDGDADEPF